MQLSSSFLALLVLPVAVLASSPVDRQIEDGIKASYNFRTLLHDRVTVHSNAGVVTLTGDVRDLDEKRLADDTVANIPGVTQVKNELRLNPTVATHSDSWIAFKLRLRLLTKANVNSGTTSIAVQNGIVTLTGTAENQAQKELTEVYAQETEWVKAVHNLIAVQSPSRRG